MNKQEFLDRLRGELSILPSADTEERINFYSEMIDDRIEDGHLEEDAVLQIGDIQEIAKQILADTPITKLAKQKIKRTRRISALEIVLLVLGSPIWLSLILSAVAVALSVYVSLWSVVISLWACEAAFVGSAFGGFVSAIVIFATGQNTYAGVMMLAGGIFLVGFSILFSFVCKWVTKGMIWLTKKLTLWIKSLFLRKEKSQ